MGPYATAASAFDDLAVDTFRGPAAPDFVPEPEGWEAATDYVAGDLRTHEGAALLASWWTRTGVPGEPYGPWAARRLTAMYAVPQGRRR